MALIIIFVAFVPVFFLAIGVINIAEGVWEKDRNKMVMAGRCIGIAIVAVAVSWIIRMML